MSLVLSSISNIALVSHNYNPADEQGLHDYSQHFVRINKLCDEQGCDTILYALYTWDERSPVPKSHESIFGNLAHVQRVIMEIGEPTESYDHLEVWLRNQTAPLLVRQMFAFSYASDKDKQGFIDGLASRRIAEGLLVICGETNIVSAIRGSDRFSDPFGFVGQLQGLKARIILNPVHDYMARPEMRKKRCFFSQGGRTAISVWNQGRGKEPYLPWTVFHNGIDRTADVRELPPAFVVGMSIHLMDMIADRRVELFPDVHKIIVDYEVEISGGRLTLHVTSAPIPDLSSINRKTDRVAG